MTIVFQVKGISGEYTVDPEVVPDSKNLEDGDYVRLPKGQVVLCNSIAPPKFTKISSEEVPSDVVILNAQEIR